MTDANADIDVVKAKLAKAREIVFLTGAGLSVASGIAPYRKSKDAVWSRFITEWGTIERFHENPAEWWREFWIKAHGPLAGEGSLDSYQPNAGHQAITQIVAAARARNADALVITQNIDGLHRRAGVPEDQLVEIHGRHDRFVCTRDGCSRVLEPLHKIALDENDLANGKFPVCDRCGAPLRPLVLLFDEMYDSHPIFQMRKARKALNDADIIVFVGTSFSVGITDYAVRAGLYANATLVNVNVEPMEDGRWLNLTGPAEVILPALV